MLGCALYINKSDFTYLRHCPDLQQERRKKETENICTQYQIYTEAAVQQLKAQSDEYRW